MRQSMRCKTLSSQRDAYFPLCTQDLQERDLRDTTRSAAPLKAADDAHVLDTSGMTADEVVLAAEGLIMAACPWLEKKKKQ